MIEKSILPRLPGRLLLFFEVGDKNNACLETDGPRKLLIQFVLLRWARHSVQSSTKLEPSSRGHKDQQLAPIPKLTGTYSKTDRYMHSPSLISRTVSVDVKHHVYLLTYVHALVPPVSCLTLELCSCKYSFSRNPTST